MPVSLEKASDWICLSDLARELGVSRAAPTNWHQRHADFPHIETLGGMSYVKRQDVYAWLDKDNRWETIQRRQSVERKPRVRKDVGQILRLIAEHEEALKRLHRELSRAQTSQTDV
ncbi:hypothetical protein ACFU6R_03160 [Streptomyces sp. NPDC057499]|uniref:hypothetical protein n=1 Tax=Streptomyces sp. NPDC057499 TaxID=3346150 RepID=UPI003693C101